MIVEEMFLMLQNLHMLLKQTNKKSPSHPRSLVPGCFGELLIVFSIKVDLLCFLYSTDQRCCLLLLIEV